TARGVVGLFPARSVGDDIEVDGAGGPIVFHQLRQQRNRKGDGVYRSLSDYIAPAEAGKPDWLGAFAVTTGLGVTEKIAEFKADHDDYSAIMVEALADRLAEAFAERMHQRVRTEFWAYAPD